MLGITCYDVVFSLAEHLSSQFLSVCRQEWVYQTCLFYAQQLYMGLAPTYR